MTSTLFPEDVLTAKAVSFHQPWGSAVVLGAKGIETRCWYTDYRGPLLIHAAKRYQLEQTVLGHQPNWYGALDRRELALNRDEDEIDRYMLPAGALIGMVDLVDCFRTEQLELIGDLDKPRWREWDPMFFGLERRRFRWTEREMGDFRPNRFGWIFENVRRFKTPIPHSGNRRIFNVPKSVIAGAVLIDVPLCGQETYREAILNG